MTKPQETDIGNAIEMAGDALANAISDVARELEAQNANPHGAKWICEGLQMVAQSIDRLARAVEEMP